LNEPEATGAAHNRVAIFIVVGALTGIAPLSIDAYKGRVVGPQDAEAGLTA
jgi:hypothetical protein